MSTPLWQWDATALAAAIAAREISAREAVRSCVDRMHDVNPRINAVTVDLSQQALADADRLDAAIGNGEATGSLAGVPITIKENVDQIGCATTNGVAAFRDLVAGADSPVVVNLKRAGAIVIGRTNTPAFSFRLDTVNDFRGRTYSPWSRTRTPGGSSGGASASVAAGITPIAHGNDIAGSVRYPAYCTGLVGLRPSFGRIPAFNATTKVERPISAQLMSVQGPLARSVRDVRTALQVMAMRDPRDPWWVPAPLVGAPIGAPIRVAVVNDAEQLGGVAPSPAVRDALSHAARALTDAGYVIVGDATPGFNEAFELWFQMLVPEFRRFMQADFERDGDDGIRTAMRYMLDNVPDAGPEEHLRALAHRSRLVREWTAFLEQTPLVLAPICTRQAYEHGFDIESAHRTRQIWRESATLMAVPVLGLPAVSVPTGVTDGLPLGIQIIAPRFREDLCLAAAEAIEARSPRITPIDPV
ncbi:MAG TPA: amidase family protein [Casimicrobiaceae bacterium]|nr:amidase family protein [Casimicrobiaceae bacterium]